MSFVAVLPRLLGVLFYSPPDKPEAARAITVLPVIADVYPWPDPDAVQALCSSWDIPDDEALNWQFSVLFEGQGEMCAPPWGSVYQHRDNLLMGETTERYRGFLHQQALGFTGQVNEPEDQFGLMLLALAALLEREDEVAARTLLEEHLLPWSGRYLECLQNNGQSAFYARLAQITALFLQTLQQRYALRIRPCRIYF